MLKTASLRVLLRSWKTFTRIDESMDVMKSITLDEGQQHAFAKAALTLAL